MSDTPEFDLTLNRLARQVDEIVRRQNEMKTIVLDPALVESEARRYALHYAQDLMKGNRVGIINAASVLGVADMYSKWLVDGTLPDMAAEAGATAAFAWNLLSSMFAPEVVEKAKKLAKK